MWKRGRQNLAYFDASTSNSPVEAPNGPVKHLRSSALGIRNRGHYILLIDFGKLQTRIKVTRRQ
ncbi:transposase [Dietzia natronolimnaea]|nr:transposase [Dietzia natronolimnaea]